MDGLGGIGCCGGDTSGDGGGRAFDRGPEAGFCSAWNCQRLLVGRGPHSFNHPNWVMIELVTAVVVGLQVI